MNKQFDEIIEQHKGILFKVSRAYCPNEEDRQDLLQEIMLQLWLSLKNFKNQCKISTWIYRISLNVAISFNRKRNLNYTELNDQYHQISTEDQAESEHQSNLLLQFIDELKEIDKAIMLLYLEDKSHADISEILGISISNVGTKISRIKEQLKNRFSNFK